MTDAPPLDPSAADADDEGPGTAGPTGSPGDAGSGGFRRRRRSGKPPKSSARNITEWVVVLVGALVIAGLIRAFLFQAFYIPSPSMNPTLVQNDRVVVNKLSYDLHDVHRGDIVVFSRPPGVPKQDKDLIKRVVGLPGETVSLRDGHVFIDGKQLDEPYTAKGSTSLPLELPTCVVDLERPLTIPAGQVFVMGDNRDQSLDSRCFGPIPESHIVGRAFVLIWPLSHLGWL